MMFERLTCERALSPPHMLGTVITGVEFSQRGNNAKERKPSDLADACIVSFGTHCVP